MAAPGRGGRGVRVSCTSCLLVSSSPSTSSGHQDLIVLVFTMIDLQHVLHGAHEFGIALRREAPALLQPRLEFVFFRVRRTVSGLMLSTISRSTNPSASICMVQLTRPSGGWEMAMANRWASPWPSNFL